MDFSTFFIGRRFRQHLLRRRNRSFFPPIPSSPSSILLLFFTAAFLTAVFSFTKLYPNFPQNGSSKSSLYRHFNNSTGFVQGKVTDSRHFSGRFAEFPVSRSHSVFSQIGTYLPSPQQLNTKKETFSSGPYHDWEGFEADYQEMLRNLKIFVYPDAFEGKHSSSFNSSFARIFLPLSNPKDPNLGNYYSEHAFKIALLRSSLITKNPEEANFFFLPFSINVMRNHPLVHSALSISNYVAEYTRNISSEFRHWNASGGADHFYVCCHSIGRDAASKHPALHTNAIQVTCSSSYFQRLYITHKDIGLPQIWPRPEEPSLNPPDQRKILLFFAGRAQNSLARQKILDMWSNDTSFTIFSGRSGFPYNEGFRRSRYCLHVKGYEVNTARVSDAIHYGCIPVLISNYYDLPFANILDWSKFSIIISEGDIPLLKEILSSVSEEMYLKMYKNLGIVRKHFIWHSNPKSYDSFYMTAYQLWLRRGLYQLFPSV